MPQKSLYRDPSVRKTCYSSQLVFLDWQQMTTLFKRAAEHFGAIDIVIANAEM
ncbi:hypothetical protein BDV27DRAFT_119209, partial [Aspergillus caelatus]